MNRLKFKTSGELLIILEEYAEPASKYMKNNQNITRYNWLDLETQGSWPIMSIVSPNIDLWVANYYRTFMLDEWEVRSYSIIPPLSHLFGIGLHKWEGIKLPHMSIPSIRPT